jgi:chromosome segregation ATPase
MAVKEEYIEKLEKQLKEWNNQLKKLEYKAKSQQDSMSKEAQKQLKRLREQRDELSQKLTQLRDSGQVTFDKVKKDADAMWSDLKSGFKEAQSIFRD